MQNLPSNGLFITGTDTNVGKTYVSSLLAKRLVVRGVRVGVYKPVASGASFVDGRLMSDDARQLWEAAGRPLTMCDVCPQTFAAPLAPHLAAREEGKTVDPKLLRSGIGAWRGHEAVLVEGAGGLCSPISDDDLVADLATDFAYPLLVVANNTLGAINQVLQTVLVATSFNLAVTAVILNQAKRVTGDLSVASNAEELTKRLEVPVLGPIEFGQTDSRCLEFVVDRLVGDP